MISRCDGVSTGSAGAQDRRGTYHARRCATHAAPCALLLDRGTRVAVAAFRHSARPVAGGAANLRQSVAGPSDSARDVRGSVRRTACRHSPVTACLRLPACMSAPRQVAACTPHGGSYLPVVARLHVPPVTPRQVAAGTPLAGSCMAAAAACVCPGSTADACRCSLLLRVPLLACRCSPAGALKSWQGVAYPCPPDAVRLLVRFSRGRTGWLACRGPPDAVRLLVRFGSGPPEVAGLSLRA